MLLSAPVRPTRCMCLSCWPAVRLYTTSAEVSGLPSDHLTPFAMPSVSVLLPLLQVQERASHGTGLRPPSPTTTRGSYIAPWTKLPLGRPVAVYGLKFLTNAGSPDPVITTHWWPWAERTDVAAGADAATTSTTRPTSGASQLVRRMLRRISGILSGAIGEVGRKRFRERYTA